MEHTPTSLNITDYRVPGDSNLAQPNTWYGEGNVASEYNAASASKGTHTLVANGSANGSDITIRVPFTVVTQSDVYTPNIPDVTTEKQLGSTVGDPAQYISHFNDGTATYPNLNSARPDSRYVTTPATTTPSSKTAAGFGVKNIEWVDGNDSLTGTGNGQRLAIKVRETLDGVSNDRVIEVPSSMGLLAGETLSAEQINQIVAHNGLEPSSVSQIGSETKVGVQKDVRITYSDNSTALGDSVQTSSVFFSEFPNPDNLAPEVKVQMVYDKPSTNSLTSKTGGKLTENAADNVITVNKGSELNGVLKAWDASGKISNLSVTGLPSDVRFNGNGAPASSVSNTNKTEATALTSTLATPTGAVITSNAGDRIVTVTATDERGNTKDYKLTLKVIEQSQAERANRNLRPGTPTVVDNPANPTASDIAKLIDSAKRGNGTLTGQIPGFEDVSKAMGYKDTIFEDGQVKFEFNDGSKLVVPVIKIPVAPKITTTNDQLVNKQNISVPTNITVDNVTPGVTVQLKDANGNNVGSPVTVAPGQISVTIPATNIPAGNITAVASYEGQTSANSNAVQASPDTVRPEVQIPYTDVAKKEIVYYAGDELDIRMTATDNSGQLNFLALVPNNNLNNASTWGGRGAQGIKPIERITTVTATPTSPKDGGKFATISVTGTIPVDTPYDQADETKNVFTRYLVARDLNNNLSNPSNTGFINTDPGAITFRQGRHADKFADVNVTDKVLVRDANNLSQSDRDKIISAIKQAHRNDDRISTENGVTFNGSNVTITYGDKTTRIIPLTDLVTVDNEAPTIQVTFQIQDKATKEWKDISRNSSNQYVFYAGDTIRAVVNSVDNSGRIVKSEIRSGTVNENSSLTDFLDNSNWGTNTTLIPQINTSTVATSDNPATITIPEATIKKDALYAPGQNGSRVVFTDDVVGNRGNNSFALQQGRLATRDENLNPTTMIQVKSLSSVTPEEMAKITDLIKEAHGADADLIREVVLTQANGRPVLRIFYTDDDTRVDINNRMERSYRDLPLEQVASSESASLSLSESASISAVASTSASLSQVASASASTSQVASVSASTSAVASASA